MKTNRLLKKTGLYFIGNLSSKMLVAILIPIYAFSVKPDELGYFDYTQTIMNIIVPIFFLAIWEAILKFLLNKDGKYEKDKVICSSMIWAVGISIVYVVSTFLLNSLQILEIKYYTLVTLMIISYALAQIFQYYARGLEKNQAYVLASILGVLINFVLVIVFMMIFKIGIKGLYYAYIAGQLSIVIIIGQKLNIWKYLKVRFIDKKLLKEMLKFSTPLVLNTISAWLITGYGKIIINNKLGEVENGIYSFATKFPLIITTLGSIIAMAIIEEAIITSNDKNFGKDFGKTVNQLFKIFMSVVTIAIPVIFIAFEFFKETQYYEAKNYIIALMLYAFFTTMSTNVGSVFQAVNKTKYQFITTVIGGIVCLLISNIFIGKFGIQAVVVAQALGMLITLIMRYIFAIKCVSIYIDVKSIFITIILYIIVSIVAIKNNIYGQIFLLGTTIIIAIMINKQFIKNIFAVLQTKLKKENKLV